MRFDFLAAACGTPLTKTFTLTDQGDIQVGNYPLIKNFNSFTENFNTIEEALKLLKKHGELGHCLLKGHLITPLNDEPRAGRTVSEHTTEYLVIDNDFSTGFANIDQFLMSLSPELHDVSYIFQHSGSAGIKGDAGLRGHIFILLDKATSPAVIKQWLISRNLVMPELEESFLLSSNGQSIRWPVDTTTCQNDKLIYIANPICNGLEDPIKDARFELHIKSKPKATINFKANPAVNKERTEAKIDALRTEMGLKKKKAKYKNVQGEQILLNPDPSIVTETKEMNGFIRVNLYGENQSWGYYHSIENPEILYNFKGEPPVYLKDIAPEYYASLHVQTESDNSETPVVFRDRTTDTYYNGLYKPMTAQLELYPVANIVRIDHFLQQYGKAMPEYIEDWTLEFDPTKDSVIDFDKRWANKFSPSEYMIQQKSTVHSIPTQINKVISSVCVDKETHDHFINWLAYVFQTRTKATTAWIFHGVQGTGKGILFEKILSPLFGHKYAVQFTTQSIEEQFNQNLEECIIMWLDEFRVDDTPQATKLLNKIKNLITENQVIIRGMRRNPVQRNVFNNVIIATNHVDPVPLDDGDRRFNVAPAQERPLQIASHEVEMIEAELHLFASFLQTYNVNELAVRTVLKNSARNAMIGASETSIQAYFTALRHGDLDFFMDYIRAKPPVGFNTPYRDFKEAVTRWASELGTEVLVTREEMMAVYEYLQNTQTSVTKFTRMCKINRLDVKPYRVDNEHKRGVKIDFTTKYPEDISSFLAATPEPEANNVVKLKGAL